MYSSTLFFFCLFSTVVYGCSVSVNPDIVAIDLSLWNDPTGVGDWTVTGAYNNAVTQSINTGPPTYFISNFEIETYQVMRGFLRVPSGDDDYIGFVMGADCTPAAPNSPTTCSGELITLTWGTAYSNSVRGLCLVRGNYGVGVTCNSAGAVRAATLGNSPWIYGYDHDFIIQYTPTRVRVWVDGVQQFDYTLSPPMSSTAKRAGFYALSQGNLYYSNFHLLNVGTASCSSNPLTVTIPYSAGTVACATSTSARVDWGDGTTPTVHSGTSLGGGDGEVIASHLYSSPGTGYYNIDVDLLNGGVVVDTYTFIGFVLDPVTVSMTPRINGQCGFHMRCDSNNGAIDLTINGGSTPYSSSWNDGTIQNLPGSCSGSGCGTRTGLALGSYSVSVTDLFGCADSASVTLTTSATTISSLDTSVCGNIDLTASSTASCSPLTYAWSTSNGNGLSPSSQDQTGLSAGTYSVLVTDPNGCTDSESATLTQSFQNAPSLVYMYHPTEFEWTGFPSGTSGQFSLNCASSTSQNVYTGDVSSNVNSNIQPYGLYPGTCTWTFTPTSPATCTLSHTFILCASEFSVPSICENTSP